MQIRNFFWVLPLVVIAICAFFAAKSVNNLIVGNLPRPKTRKASRGVRPAMPAVGPKSRDVSAILARNVFCSECNPATEVEAQGTAEAPAAGDNSGEPVKSSLNLRLLATLVSVEDRAWSFAALHDPGEDRTHMYRIGTKLASVDATVVDIMSRRVLLQRGARTEYIELATADEPKAAKKPTRRRPRRKSSYSKFTEAVTSGVRKVGPGKWEIQRSALNKVLANTTMLARSARIVPSVRNGKANGFKLYAIRPNSVYAAIGMRNGDTIHSINGHAIRTPDQALAIYTKVRNASHLTISFTRRGKATTHDYTIR